MATFDQKRLETSLRKMSPWKQIAFMAHIGERMLPNYQRFSAIASEGWDERGMAAKKLLTAAARVSPA